MRKIFVTLETDSFDEIESIEVNFKNHDKYDHVTRSTFDEDGNIVQMQTEYTYLDEMREGKRHARDY